MHHGDGLGMQKLFEEYDRDGSGTLTYNEFHKACKRFGFGSVSRQIFDSFDMDGSGSVAYHELGKAVRDRTTAAPAKTFLIAMLYRSNDGEAELFRVPAQAGPAGAGHSASASVAPPTDVYGSLQQLSTTVQREILPLLRDNEDRLLSLFRAWDEGGDGRLSLKEVKNALESLGYTGDAEAVRVFFDAVDTDVSRQYSPGLRPWHRAPCTRDTTAITRMCTTAHACTTSPRAPACPCCGCRVSLLRAEPSHSLASAERHFGRAQVPSIFARCARARLLRSYDALASQPSPARRTPSRASLSHALTR